MTERNSRLLTRRELAGLMIASLLASAGPSHAATAESYVN